MEAFIVEEIVNFADYGANVEDIKFGNISIASEDFVAIRIHSLMPNSEFVVINLKTKETKRLPARGTAYALSPNGAHIACFNNYTLEMIDVNTGNILGACEYDQSTDVSIMKWLNDNTVWIASNTGIELWSLSSMDETMLVLEYYDDFDYKQVVNFQLSHDNSWYIVHYKDEKIGTMQLGQLGGSFFNMMEGRAGQFFVANNRFYNDPLVSYFYRKSDNPNKYFLKTDNLSDPSKEYMTPGSMDWTDSLLGNFATHMICDPKGCIAILTTNSGSLQLWDVREGFILVQSEVSFPVEDLLPCQDHFIGVKTNTTILSRVGFDTETVLKNCFKRRFNEQLPLHVGCRYELRDLTHPTVAKLMEAHYHKDIPTLTQCLVQLSRNAVNEKMLLANPKLIVHSIEFIWNTRMRKHGVDWEAELNWFFTTYKKEKARTIPSPLPCEKTLSLAEMAEEMGQEEYEVMGTYFAQELGINVNQVNASFLIYKLSRLMGDGIGMDLFLSAIDEEDREGTKKLLERLKEWEDNRSPYENDTFEKLVEDLKQSHEDEYSDQANHRLERLFPDAVQRAVQRVNLRHQLRGDTPSLEPVDTATTKTDSTSAGEKSVEVVMQELNEYAQLIPDHVEVKHIDVTELALQVLASDEQEHQYSVRTLAAMKTLSEFEQAKVMVLMNHEVKRLEPLFPYLPFVRSCVRLGVEAGSPAFRALMDEEIGRDETKRREAEKVVKNLLSS